jgi:hypothetical protein
VDAAIVRPAAALQGENPVNDFIRLLAAWALVHEAADEGWKAAVARGRADTPGGPEAFVDGLAALVAEETKRLKAELAESPGATRTETGVADRLDALAFELAELRGRIETLQASIDALAARGRS